MANYLHTIDDDDEKETHVSAGQILEDLNYLLVRFMKWILYEVKFVCTMFCSLSLMASI